MALQTPKSKENASSQIEQDWSGNYFKQFNALHVPPSVCSYLFKHFIQSPFKSHELHHLALQNLSVGSRKCVGRQVKHEPLRLKIEHLLALQTVPYILYAGEQVWHEESILNELQKRALQ